MCEETLALFEDILDKGMSLRVRATGRSMTPSLGTGEVITIRQASCSSLKRGDLLFLKNVDGYPVIHRLVNKKKRHNVLTFQTRGDALIALDRPVREENILGKVCELEKGQKHINLEKPYWRYANFLRATYNLCESRLYFTLCAIKKLLV